MAHLPVPPIVYARQISKVSNPVHLIYVARPVNEGDEVHAGGPLILISNKKNRCCLR